MSQSYGDQEQFKKTLGRNIYLPILLSLFTAAVFGGLIYSIIQKNRWVDHTDQVIGQINRVLKVCVDAETGLRGYLVTGHEVFLEPYNHSLLIYKDLFEDLKNSVSDNAAQVARIETFAATFKSWLDSAKEVVTNRRAANYVLDIDREYRGKAMMDSIRHQVAEMLENEENLKAQRIDETNNSIRVTLIALFSLSLGLGVILAVFGRRQLQILSETYEAALTAQKKQNEALVKGEWLRTGRSNLADEFLGELSLLNSSQKGLDFIVNYLGASLGTFYTAQGGSQLIRRAGYGLAKGAQEKNTEFQFGESLVGQVARDRKTVVLQQVPADYFKVNSSLGEALPQSLLIMPTHADGSINGVIELGFIDQVDERRVEFLREVADLLGAAIKSAIYRERLEELLSQSQQLTEELQQQQEELRVSNEELEENSRALKQTQGRLEEQHAELEQTNEQLEEQARTLEQQKDAINARNEDLRRAQEGLIVKTQELQDASTYKSEFLANMSHELRTPLNSSLILAKLLMDNASGNLSREQVDFASTIYASGNDLLTLINDILDLSKVEAGKLEIHAERFSTTTMTSAVERVFKGLADEKKLNFFVAVDVNAPTILETDRQRLEQILKNFLSNAFKFTHEGEVRLEVRPGEQSREVLFIVSDSGIGIAKDQQQIIFDAFRQADGAVNRRYGGTGLGLTISRDLAQLLGGNISVESENGKGSRFTLSIPSVYVAPEMTEGPYGAAMISNPGALVSAETLSGRAISGNSSGASGLSGLASASAPAWRPPRKRGSLESGFLPDPDDDAKKKSGKSNGNASGEGQRKLLIIEDDHAFAKILIDLAQEQKFTAIWAETADEGLRLTAQEKPSAIILDIKLPDHSGLAVLDRLKQTSKTRHIPVHIVSSEDQTEAALKMGAIGYIVKPVQRDDLVKVFHNLESKITQKIKNVLVVEDDDTQLKSICRLIQSQDVETSQATSGQQAIAQLTAKTFDCMIIDLRLPDMTGFELLEKMTVEDHAHPPVIVYTGQALTRAEEDQLRKYSRSVIIKGARSPERLLDEVSLFLHQVEAKMDPAKQTLLVESRNRERIFEERKILIVDDDVRNIFALTSALELKGAKIVIARNGKESLDVLEANSGIDLVLMDIMMPVMDGFEAMKRIRADKKFAKLAIIAVTAKAMKDDQEKCLDAGANDYLSKPIDIEKLMSLIRVWMPRADWQ